MKTPRLPVKYLKQKFEELRNNIPNLDNGGCGIFAVLLYEKLKESGFTPRVVTITRDPWGVKTNFKNGPIETPFCHFVVRVGDNFIDPFIIANTFKKFCQNDPDWQNTTHLYCIDYTTLKEWVACEDAWNQRFNRNRIPELRSFIDELELSNKRQKYHWVEAMLTQQGGLEL
jgi:hypothetical protein